MKKQSTYNPLKTKIDCVDWAWKELQARREMTEERNKPHLFRAAKRYARMYSKEENPMDEQHHDGRVPRIGPVIQEPDSLLNLPQAPASINFFYISPKGFNHQMTMKGWDYHKLIDEALAVEEYLLSLDCKPKHVGAPQDQPPAETTPPPAEHAAEDQPPVFEDAYYDDDPLQGLETFICDSLWGESKGDKDYWKIRGVSPPLHKWGVRVWPEVLKEAGFDITKLDVKSTYTMRGWRAHFVRNNKGEAEKIVKLEKFE